MLANDEFQHEILVIEMRTLVIFFLKKKKLGLICSDDYRVKHKKKPQLISFDFLQKLDRDCDFFSLFRGKITLLLSILQGEEMFQWNLNKGICFLHL